MRICDNFDEQGSSFLAKQVRRSRRFAKAAMGVMRVVLSA